MAKPQPGSIDLRSLAEGWQTRALTAESKLKTIMAKTAAPHCPIHPEVKLVCPACLAGRNKGITSKAKAKASARNGRLGGRPKLPRHSAACDVQTTGRYTAGCKRCQYDEKRDARTFALPK